MPGEVRWPPGVTAVHARSCATVRARGGRCGGPDDESHGRAVDDGVFDVKTGRSREEIEHA